MVIISKGPLQIKEPSAPFSGISRMGTEDQALGLSCASSLGAFEGSWMGNEAAGTGLTVLLGGSLSHYVVTTVPPHFQNTFKKEKLWLL